MDALSHVRAGYDRWSAIYDHDANPLQALEEPLVIRAAGEVRGKSVADLGCGTGRHTLWLVGEGAVVTAVDFSPGMLDEARRKIGPAEVLFLEHNLQLPLPLADRMFDLVVSGLVLEHLSNLPAFFGDVRRILSDGGRAVISAMHPAMFLRNSQARFTDPASGEVIAPGSINHSLSGMIVSAFRSGLYVDDVSEHAPDRAFAQRYPRAEKYIGWPMLIVIELSAR